MYSQIHYNLLHSEQSESSFLAYVLSVIHYTKKRGRKYSCIQDIYWDSIPVKVPCQISVPQPFEENCYTNTEN